MGKCADGNYLQSIMVAASTSSFRRIEAPNFSQILIDAMFATAMVADTCISPRVRAMAKA